MDNEPRVGTIGATQGVSRPMTFGERAVGLGYNQTGNEKVQEIKTLYATIIDLLNDQRGMITPGESSRLYSVAITEAQTAQVWAVKAVTWE